MRRGTRMRADIHVKRLTLILLIWVATSATVVSAQVIRLASGAPESSPWGAALNRVAADWQRISNGRVELQIFHNGIAGDERDVLRKMRIGQVQAGVFTSVGLEELAPEIMVLSMPVLIRSDEELISVFERLQPEFDAAVSRNRFTALGWSRPGWVRFFTSRSVRTPAELRQIRLAASAENPELLQAFRVMGYQAFPVTQNELLTSLNSGMVDGFYASPIAAAGFQWFARAPHMLDLPVAPFLGAFVVSDRAWARVPNNLKPQLAAAVESHIGRLDDAARDLEAEAIRAMRGFGLQTTELTESERQAWFAEFERSLPLTVGRVFDESTYRQVQAHLAEIRR